MVHEPVENGSPPRFILRRPDLRAEWRVRDDVRQRPVAAERHHLPPAERPDRVVIAGRSTVAVNHSPRQRYRKRQPNANLLGLTEERQRLQEPPRL
jgi:hypothetical protein